MGRESRQLANAKLSEAYNAVGKSLAKYCRVRLGDAADEADDCVQEAFCVYYKRLLNGEEFQNPRAFLYRTADIMVRRAKEEYVIKAQHTASLESAENTEVFIPDENAADIDYDAVKEILISSLSEDEQLLYQQKYVEGLSLKEIGKALDIAPAAVANRTSRLRAKIKRLIEPVLENEKKGGS
ncbi:MAG: sigma-70 family RNA polymerase sigma factor [Eubacterium sp.]|nr:sigma-70 family RNA polymerase sigma factor [Eubacterium sp.]